MKINPSDMPANAVNVTAYLKAAYLITVEEAAALVNKHADEVSRSERLRSLAYYPGDQIARAEGLEENPDFDPDEGDEEPDDEE